MYSEKEITRTSKFLSLVLRHKPETIDLHLDENGWTEVAALISKMKRAGHDLDLDKLKYVVENNNKQRFAFDASGRKIRANQGHSIEVDLNLTPQKPPEILFHGTATKNLSSIFALGLEKRNRQHVHLSPDEGTAIKVGARHGNPVVLQITAGKMYAEGHVFYQSDNGVWLTDHVPPEYILPAFQS
jgi:putative RNA 2'-phosphotransferase